MKCDKNSVQMSKLIGVFLDYGSFSELFFDGSGKRKISSPAFPFKLFFQLIGPKHAIALLVAWTGVCVGVWVCVGGGGGGVVLGLIFAGYVPLSFQSPYPIIVYFFSNYTPQLSHFLENVISAIPT